jgi:hypothetical protein
MVPLKQIKASEKELKKSTRGICSAQRGIARWCSGQRNDLTPIKHSRLWIPRGRETCRQEFESPPGYHDKPRNFSSLSLFKQLRLVDLTDIIESCFNQFRSLFNGLCYSTRELIVSFKPYEVRVEHRVVDVSMT